MKNNWTLTDLPIKEDLETKNILKSLPKPYTKIEFLIADLGVSRVTASGYLNKLAADGILKKEKVGNANFYINEVLFDLLLERKSSK